jgi:hypothetical protein
VDLGLRLRAAGRSIVYVPGARVEHSTASWNPFPSTLRRFFAYGRGDAHLLRAHPELRGPLAPSLPAVLLALAGAAGMRAVLDSSFAWLLVPPAVLLVTVALHLLLGVRHGLASALSSTGAWLLMQWLGLGRQIEALKLRRWVPLLHEVVLDEDQLRREAAARLRAWLALLPAALVPLAFIA